MSTPEPEDVAKRLDRLERQNRWWKGVAVVSLLGLSSVFLIGQTSRDPGVVVARTFILKSPDDKVVAILGERPALPFFAPHLNDARNGSYRTAEGTWGLHVFGPNGFIRASLQLGVGGDTMLQLLDGETNNSIGLKVGGVLNSQGKFSPGAFLSMDVKKQTRKEYERQRLDWLEKAVSANTEEERTKASSKFAAQTQQPEHSALLQVSNDDTGLTLSEKGEERVLLGHARLETPQGVRIQRPLSSLVFFDKDGKMMWEAP